MQQVCDFVDERPPRRKPIDHALVDRGWTGKFLSKKIGRHEVVMYQILSGRIQPTKAECYLISWELDAHPSELFPDLTSIYDWSDYREWVEGCLLDHRMRRGHSVSSDDKGPDR